MNKYNKSIGEEYKYVVAREEEGEERKEMGDAD